MGRPSPSTDQQSSRCGAAAEDPEEPFCRSCGASRGGGGGGGAEEPLVRGAPPAAPAPIDRRGVLRKRGHVRRNWTTRHFEVGSGALCYFDREGGRMLRAIHLSGERIECAPFDAAAGAAPAEHAFSLRVASADYALDLCAASEDDMASWIRAICRNSFAAFTPEPLIAGELRGRKTALSSGLPTVEVSFRAFDAKLTCSRLALAPRGDAAPRLVYINVARADAWDGKGRARTYAAGFVVVADDGARWQFTCADADPAARDAWLRCLRGSCGSNELVADPDPPPPPPPRRNNE